MEVERQFWRLHGVHCHCRLFSLSKLFPLGRDESDVFVPLFAAQLDPAASLCPLAARSVTDASFAFELIYTVALEDDRGELEYESEIHPDTHRLLAVTTCKTRDSPTGLGSRRRNHSRAKERILK